MYRFKKNMATSTYSVLHVLGGVENEVYTSRDLKATCKVLIRLQQLNRPTPVIELKNEVSDAWEIVASSEFYK